MSAQWLLQNLLQVKPTIEVNVCFVEGIMRKLMSLTKNVLRHLLSP